MNSSLENAERLSAFLDDELASTDVDALLDALENPACRQQLLRFSARDQVVQGAERTFSAAEDLGMRLRPQLQAPASSRAAKPERHHWWHGLTALLRPAVWIPAGGVAASALVAVVAWQVNAPLQTTQPANLVSASAPPASQQLATTAASSNLPVTLVGAPASLRASSASSPRELVIPAPENSKEIEQLYLQHARFRGGYLLSTPAAFARVGVQPTMAAPADAQTDP